MTLRLKTLEDALVPFRASANRHIADIRDTVNDMASLDVGNDDAHDELERLQKMVLELLISLETLIND